MNSKRQAYICTPLFASNKLDLYRNYCRATRYKNLVTSELGVPSVSPFNHLSNLLDITDPQSKGVALKIRYQVLHTCSEFVLCGEFVTAEMCDDLKAAVALEIPVYFYVDGALYFVPNPNPFDNHLTGVEIPQGLRELTPLSHLLQLGRYWELSNGIGDNFVCMEG